MLFSAHRWYHSDMTKLSTFIIFVIIVVALLTAQATSIQAYEIKVIGDRFSLTAEQMPLQDVLSDLSARTGTNVRIDPALNPQISADFEDKTLQQGLESILKGLNHVLLWESVPTPSGASTR